MKNNNKKSTNKNLTSLPKARAWRAGVEYVSVRVYYFHSLSLVLPFKLHSTKRRARTRDELLILFFFY